MRTLVITILFAAICATLPAQSPNADEWLRQKRTQRKYLIQQIAALKIYLQYLKKGYDIAQKGLTQIGEIKDDAFGRDQDYLYSLRQVSPVIRNSPKLKEILAYEKSILKILRELNDSAGRDPNLTPGEVNYIGNVYFNMLIQVEASINELIVISTAEASEMKDDQRITRLYNIHADMADKYAFAKDFADGSRLLSMERARDQHAVTTARKLLEL